MRERIDLGKRSVGDMAENIAALFGADDASPEAIAGAFALADCIALFMRKNGARK